MTNADEDYSAVEVVTKSVELVEEENPDCVILVYAVDDRATFGKRDKNIMIWDYQNHFFQPIFIWNLQFQNLRKTCLFTYKEAEVLRESQAS